MKDPFLNIYSIGDLDDFFWEYTNWFALQENTEIKSIALLYKAPDLPVLLAISEKDDLFMKDLLSSIISLLPRKFYCHLTPGLKQALNTEYCLEDFGEHYKMGLKDKALLENIDTSHVFQLSVNDLPELNSFYNESYPGNWFDSRMLETNQYFAVKKNDRLVSVAGVHVYSKKLNVAALGNITTHPDFRGQGYGRLVTAKLCQSLLKNIDYIGLNVKTDNKAAISCYQKLGFNIVASYTEYMATLNSQ